MGNTNAERQARYRARLKEGASGISVYEVEVLQKQVAFLEDRLNEVRAKVGLSAVSMPKSAYKPRN